MIDPPVDEELLVTAEHVLRDAGFATRRDTYASVTCLTAESPLFILFVAAPVEIKDVRSFDESLSLTVAGAVAAADVRGKQWDVYLVLLTASHLAADDADVIYRVAYNTRYVRRLVRTNVEATYESVQSALRPFLPMTQLDQGRNGYSGPLLELEREILTQGLPEDFVRRAFASFRDRGEVIDA